MKLGIWVDNVYVKRKDDYSTDETFIKFILSFHKYFDEINFLGRVKNSETPGPYLIDKKKNNIIEIPFYNNVVHLCVKYPHYINIVKTKLEAFVMENDTLFVCVPHPIALHILKFSRKHNKRAFIFVRQNYKEYIRARYQGFKGYFAGLSAVALDYLTDRFCKSYPVIAFGREMYERYSRLSVHTVLAVDSRWSESDIISRNDLKDIDWSKRIHILFVGRLDHEKGLHYLFQALARIKLFDFKVSIVGEGPLKNELIKTCRELYIDDKVSFLGYIPYGDRLYEQYQQADLFILPSITEGLPQVILEAMIKGVLVLASSTGGIPDIIKHRRNGFLFEAGNTSAIFDLLQSLPKSQQDLTAAKIMALETASEFTQEKQHRMFEKLCWEAYGLTF